MAILKCKMCGGDIELSSDKTIGVCDSCGCTMTFPKVDDEQRANMFNRGNHFRRQGEFDKALAVYERIVQEDENDAEAHWCCALCRFGIEYVEDPNTFEYLPTCHRASFDSFLEDVDYLAALEHSEGITRRQYQKDAQKIAEVQRGILATSQNEEPFDVFLCYKETEDDGRRTRDSLFAQDIYYQLTEQGRRVFFSRITLEDKAGTEYEPYIFAALNSAKVMIVVTTSAEHVNAVWVKNEWSRFLSLMRKDRSKLLLPCYRDMDPYDLPEALSVLQSYDMSKIGFIQDLTRGVNKVLNASKLKETVRQTVVIQQGNANVEPLLERAFMFLEDGEWENADEFFEQVLNLEPKNAEAYLGKLMAEMKVNRREQMKEQSVPFDNRKYYRKAIRFADEKLKKQLTDMIAAINDRIENEHQKMIEESRIAEERRKEEERIAEECKKEREKQMAVERKESAIAIASAIQKEFAYRSIQASLEKENQKVAFLHTNLDAVKEIQSSLSKLQTELNSINSKHSSLTAERKRLGLFARRRKDQIEIELDSLFEMKKRKEYEIKEENKKLQEYQPKEIIEENMRNADESISYLEQKKKEVEIQYISKYSYHEAIKIYTDNVLVARELYHTVPDSIKMLVLMGDIDIIHFGSFPYDKESISMPIAWKIIDRKDDKALMISDRALSCQPYNITSVSVSWETCSLRKWLNGSFLSSAFNADEQKIIVDSKLNMENNSILKDTSENTISDKVFVISASESSQYFKTDDDRKCKGTDLCYSEGAYRGMNDCCQWWLRSSRYDADHAAYVKYDGFNKYYSYVNACDISVRPAIWIDLHVEE